MQNRRYRRGGNGREWRRRQFNLLAVPEFREEDALFPRNAWLTNMGELSGLSRHLKAEFIRVPEGLVATARCLRCGAISEGLIDGRSMRNDPEWMQKTSDVITGVVVPMLGEFLQEHEECPEGRQYPVPDVLNEFVDVIYSAAKEDYAKTGEPPLWAYHMLTTDGLCFVFPLPPDLPAPQVNARERYIRVGGVHAAMRDFVRARSLDVVGIVFMSEGWMAMAEQGSDEAEEMKKGRMHAGSMPNRKEVLQVVVITPSFTKMALADIVRRSGTPEEGPADLGELNWTEHKGLSGRMMDGLMAMTDVIPLDPDEAKSKAGFVVS